MRVCGVDNVFKQAIIFAFVVFVYMYTVLVHQLDAGFSFFCFNRFVFAEPSAVNSCSVVSYNSRQLFREHHRFAMTKAYRQKVFVASIY
jgi:hypothetical protein